MNVHVQISSGPRFHTWYHTMVIAAVRKNLVEMKLKLRFKADLGALTARKRSIGIVGISKEDEELRRIFGN